MKAQIGKQSKLFETLPSTVIAFPFGIEDYKSKIIEVGNYYIWSSKKLESWADAQGYKITTDSPVGGYQYNRGLVFFSPGLIFQLKKHVNQRATDRNSGWTLVLDMGMIRKKTLLETQNISNIGYENIIRYEIFIDGIFYKKVEIGYNQNEKSPIRIHIPYIRDDEGDVTVELRLKNHPKNFGILYDAFLELN